MKNKFSLGFRFKSFGYAIDGLIVFFKTQVHAWLHFLASIAAIIAGWFFAINNFEWCIIIIAIGIVFIAEIFNTAIEFLVDKISPDYDEQAGRVKDLAAAAVLIASITAFSIGLVIFLPKIL